MIGRHRQLRSVSQLRTVSLNRCGASRLQTCLIRDAGFGCEPYREKGNALALGAKNTAECRVGLPGSTESFIASIDTYAQPDQIVPGIWS